MLHSTEFGLPFLEIVKKKDPKESSKGTIWPRSVATQWWLETSMWAFKEMEEVHGQKKKDWRCSRLFHNPYGIAVEPKLCNTLPHDNVVTGGPSLHYWCCVQRSHQRGWFSSMRIHDIDGLQQNYGDHSGTGRLAKLPNMMIMPTCEITDGIFSLLFHV